MPRWCETSHLIRIERLRQARLVLTDRLSSHLLQEVARPGKELIPTSFRLKFREEPGTHRFLIGFRKLERLFDCLFE